MTCGTRPGPPNWDIPSSYSRTLHRNCQADVSTPPLVTMVSPVDLQEWVVLMTDLVSETCPESEYIGTLPQYQVVPSFWFQSVTCSPSPFPRHRSPLPPPPPPPPQELTKKLAQYWSDVVPLPQSALDTISEGGYYTLLIRDKLRLLSFNSDYG